MQNKKKLSNYKCHIEVVRMLKNVKYVILLCLNALFYSVNAQDNSLQINIEFAVSKGIVRGSFVSFAREKVIAPKIVEKPNIDKPGDFKIEIIENKRKIGQLFFSSLAAEWAQMCADDSCKKQIFNESFRLKLPKTSFSLKLKMRNAKTGKWHLLDSARINVAQLIEKKSISHQINYLSNKKYDKKSTTLLFVPDGYGFDSTMFYSDCKRFTEAILETEPFKQFKKNIILKAVFFANDTSSVCTFKTLGIPRYLSVNNRFELARRITGVHADHVVVVYHSDIYGGSGFYNNYAAVSSSNQWSVKVFLHEFGHSFGGLGDEYVTDTAFCAVPQAGKDSYYPNVSALPNGKVKWAKLMKPTIPVPTPAIPLLNDEVGVYEGASYCPHNLYRPFQHCLMRELTPGLFCPVCSDAIVKRLKE